jgi:hypothetical protein
VGSDRSGVRDLGTHPRRCCRRWFADVPKLTVAFVCVAGTCQTRVGCGAHITALPYSSAAPKHARSVRARGAEPNVSEAICVSEITAV